MTRQESTNFSKFTTTLIEKFLCFYLLEKLLNPLEAPRKRKPYDIPPDDLPEDPRKSGKEIGSWKKNTCIWLYKFDMQFQKIFGLTIKSKGRL